LQPEALASGQAPKAATVGMITMGFGASYPGGAEQQAGLLAEELVRRGRRVLVYAPSPSIDAEARRLRRPRVVPVPALGLPRSRTATYLPMLGLVQLAPGFERADILHTHMAWVHCSVPELTSRVTGAKTVVKFACSGPDGDVHSLSRSRLGRTVLSMALKADRIVALTPAILRELEVAGFPGDRVRVIPNGVKLDGCTAPAADVDGLPHPRVLFLGRLTAQKGILPLLDAWVRVHQAVPDATLIVAGQGELLDAVTLRADKPDLGGSVRLLGHRTDVGALIAAADVVALPSRSEGMSNVALQTFAARTAFIGFAIPGISEVARHPSATVTSGDFGAFADALIAGLRDPALLDEIAWRGHEDVVAEFAIERVASRYEELYDELA
jgi:glycosyltransferase involved in cell wall biosynthesis